MKKIKNAGNNINMFCYEKYYINLNKNYIAGVDEAGRGPLAGPVFCACVVMPLNKKDIIKGVNDSKLLTEKKRNELFDKIINKAISYKVISIDEKVIDEINIYQATKLGMTNAVNGLEVKPDVVLIDALKLNTGYLEKSIIKGDLKSYSIACASILAKVSRDRYMCELDEKFPQFNFKQHKGYCTKEHINNIKKFGTCDIHRKSFLKKIVES